MPSINISEDDFQKLAMAAHRAQRDGDMEDAKALDKIARKMNAALTGNNSARKLAAAWGGQSKALSWRDMPSTLDPLDAQSPSPQPREVGQ